MFTDNKIREKVKNGEIQIDDVDSFEEQLQSIGIDLRAGPDYIVSRTDDVIDARNDRNRVLRFKPDTFYNIHTIEKVTLPDNIVGEVNPRSTLVRSGLNIETSGKVHPGFSGVLEFGVYNYTDSEIQMDVGYPIVQLSFELLDTAAETPYGNKENAKYQEQEGISGPEDFDE